MGEALSERVKGYIGRCGDGDTHTCFTDPSNLYEFHWLVYRPLFPNWSDTVMMNTSYTFCTIIGQEFSLRRLPKPPGVGKNVHCTIAFHNNQINNNCLYVAKYWNLTKIVHFCYFFMIVTRFYLHKQLSANSFVVRQLGTLYYWAFEATLTFDQ